jgi:succinate dehydrogenase / fumarate reductase membrane anchor subunit
MATDAAAATSGDTAHSLGIEPPRSRPRRTRPSRSVQLGRPSNFEMHAWLFMRISGIALVVLVLGHLLIMNVLDGGVQRINFGFVAARWASPFWRLWDLLTLWLAELHGTNGLRVVINDYASRTATRLWLKTLLYTSATLVLALGSLVIFTFDPSLNG